MSKPTIIILALVALVAAVVAVTYFGPSKEEVSVLEINGDLAEPELLKIEPEAKKVFLHVRVRSKWWLMRQVSEAEAWTTLDKAGNRRVRVGSISLYLECHGSEEKSEKKVSSVLLKNTMTGFPAVGKKRATAIANSTTPKIGPVQVSVSP